MNQSCLHCATYREGGGREGGRGGGREGDKRRFQKHIYLYNIKTPLIFPLCWQDTNTTNANQSKKLLGQNITKNKKK